MAVVNISPRPLVTAGHFLPAELMGFEIALNIVIRTIAITIAEI